MLFDGLVQRVIIGIRVYRYHAKKLAEYMSSKEFGDSFKKFVEGG